jgi:hypothetical protein
MGGMQRPLRVLGTRREGGKGEPGVGDEGNQAMREEVDDQLDREGDGKEILGKDGGQTREVTSMTLDEGGAKRRTEEINTGLLGRPIRKRQ